jgi:hypothetical protein
MQWPKGCLRTPSTPECLQQRAARLAGCCWRLHTDQHKGTYLTRLWVPRQELLTPPLPAEAKETANAWLSPGLGDWLRMLGGYKTGGGSTQCGLCDSSEGLKVMQPQGKV